MTDQNGNEYRFIASNGIESSILFYGQEKCRPNYTYRGNNIRENYIIHYIMDGQGTFFVAGKAAVTLKKGDLFILPKGIPCFYQADGKNPWQYFWIGLDGIKIANIFNSSALKGSYYLKDIESSEFTKKLREIFKVLHNKSSLENELLLEALTYQMFYHLIKEFPAQNITPKVKPYQQYEMALKYLKGNYAYGCNITDLSLSLSLSRNYLYSLFKKYSNMSPQKFLTQMRMEDAKNQLLVSEISIQSISESVGYSDAFTFSKAFKRYSGYSPLTFRKMFKK
ncbi:transcriptional regulator, AraC family [Ligilactobacillus sp. WC1T17]|uniref:Transcriptional regulator, AraC family n=1 Tax=Ligilactobacillus ruminis TaxID=1623 RepID=A0ABY1AAH7_9LACO|nr:transcriptional regulator, AraC family [Ligilactobacillus ruminis]